MKKPGDISRCVCNTCEEIKPGIWGYHTYVLQDGTEVEGVMIAVCSVCGTQLAVSHQSSHLIAKALRKNQNGDTE